VEHGRAPALPCGMHPAAQPTSPPLVFDLPVKQGRCCQSLGCPRSARSGARGAACPWLPRHRCRSTSQLSARAAPSLPHRRSIPPAPQCWSGLSHRAAVFPGADRTGTMGEGGPGNPRAGAAASEALPVLGAPGCACCPSSCSDVLVIT